MKLSQKLFALFSVLYSTPALSQELPIPSNTQVSYSTSQLSTYSGVIMGNASTLEISYAAPGSYAGSINMGANQSGGNVIIDANDNIITLSGSTNISGTTTINSGVLEGSISPFALLILNSGTAYNLNKDVTAKSLSGVAGSIINLNNYQLTIGRQNSPVNSETFSGNIIGTGSVLINGGIQLTLNGGNTYTGNTTISSGTLTTTTSSLVGNIANSDRLIFNQSTNGTYAGNISGSGPVTIEGGGEVTLTGTNSNTGKITINNDGSSLIGSTTSLSGNIVNDSINGLTFNQSTNGTYAGNITGSGPVTIEGGGQVTFTGVNSYTGGTMINGDGYLIGDTSSLVGNIINNNKSITNKSLIFNQNTTGTYAGNISGPGNVTIEGGGAITFSGVNSYTGGTTLESGSTLIGTTSSLVGSFTTSMNGGLVFSQSTNGTFGEGSITGPGFVTIQGGGTITFAGPNYYTGGTTVNGGTLSISYEGNLGGLNLILNGGALETTGVTNFLSNQSISLNGTGGTFNVAQQTLTLPCPISGSGGLIKTGPGTLALTGSNNYTGGTTVEQGTLTVNGVVQNSIDVAQGATLEGTGTIGSLTLGGTISPGNSIGTLTVLKDYIGKSTSFHINEIAPNGASDLVKVGGQAFLDGTLDMRLFKTTRQGVKNKRYTALTADNTIIGKYTHLISSDRIKYTVQYLPTSIDILVGDLQDFTDAFSAGNTSNAEKTAAYFDTFADNKNLSPDLTSVINGLDTLLGTGDSATVQNAFNQIQPSQYKELGQVSFLNNELVNRTVGSQQQNLRESLWVEKELETYAGSAALSPQRVASFHHLAKSTKGLRSSSLLPQSQSQPRHRLGMVSLPGSERIGMPANNWIKLGQSSVWIQSYGQIERTKGNHGNAGVRSETGGISVGGDHEVLKNTYLGLLGGMSTTPFHWQQNRGSGRVKSYYGGIYGTWLSQTGFYADGQIIGGGDNFNSHRNIVYPGVNRKARQRHNGGNFSTDLQAGYVWFLKHLTVQPYADATYMFINENGFREKGAQSLDFKSKGRMSQFFRGELGAQVYRTYVLCDALVRPALQLSWVHKRSVGPNSAKVQGGLVSQSQSLIVSGDNRTRNQVAPGLALTAQFADGLYIIGNVNSQFGGGQKLGDALIRIGYDF